LHVVFLYQVVKVRKDFVKQVDQLGGRHLFRHRGKIDDVGKEDACAVEVMGDRARFALQDVDDILRQNVKQQRLGSFPFASQEAQGKITFANEVVQDAESKRRYADNVQAHQSGDPARIENVDGMSGVVRQEYAESEHADVGDKAACCRFGSIDNERA